MKELDINLEILYRNDKNFILPNNDIRYNEREAMKTKLLNDYVEVIDKYNTSDPYCKEDDIFFCRLLKNMFGFEIGNYILFVFADDKDFYTEEDFGYDGCDAIVILYIKNKEQLNDFEINNNLWKQKKYITCPSNNKKNHYNIKTINIKIKCKLVLEYEEDQIRFDRNKLLM